MTDQEFLQAFVNNDRKGIKEFYTVCYPMMKASIGRSYNNLGDDDLKDLFQESMIALWNNIIEGKFQLDPKVKLTTYVIQVCKYKLMDRFKKKSFQMESSNSDWISNMDIEEQDYQESEDEIVLRKILAIMPNRCKSILEFFYFEKLKLTEIAKRLNIGQSSVKNEKYRCMNRLKSMFKELKSTNDEY